MLILNFFLPFLNNEAFCYICEIKINDTNNEIK
jgi:hypothetical protein